MGCGKTSKVGKGGNGMWETSRKRLKMGSVKWKMGETGRVRKGGK